MARYPRMCNIIQRFETPRVADIPDGENSTRAERGDTGW